METLDSKTYHTIPKQINTYKEHNRTIHLTFVVIKQEMVISSVIPTPEY